LAGKRSLTDEIHPDIREALIEMGAEDIFKCYQCGKCASACPWFQVETYDFPIFRLALEAILGMIASSEDKDELAQEIDKIYRCVGCEACVDQCPHGVNIPNIFRAGRRLLVDFGSYPEVLKSIVRKIHDVGNPLGEPREKRSDWTEGLGVEPFGPGCDYLYFSCCIPAYDPNVKSVAQATANLLKAGGTSFGILGEKESCCGEVIRRVGAEPGFEETAASNISAFKDAGVAKIIATSPHCYSSFKNDYPALKGRFDVIHTSQHLWSLIESGALRPEKSFDKKVVYHDPCVLGRQSGIYEEPRSALRSVPGLELLEVEDFNRALSVCCGAGSGGLWMEWEKDERIAGIRVRQLVDTGADVIAVACPYCLQMIEETAKSMQLDIPVLDIAQILAESCL
jgi:Fe-S oxidoreductase